MSVLISDRSVQRKILSFQKVSVIVAMNVHVNAIFKSEYGLNC